MTGVRFPAGARIFLFSTPFRSVMGPSQPPMKCILGVKRSGSEADHSPPTSANFKNAQSDTSK
jgi:hypothetical protein